MLNYRREKHDSVIEQRTKKKFSESFSSDNTRLSTSTMSSISSKISYLIDNYYYIWKNKYNIDHQIFGGFFLISGVFDLIPLVSTYVNKPLNMTISTAKNQSPLHRDSNDYWSALKHVPILCIDAQHDAPSFHDQNRQYGSYLQKIGFDNVKIMQLDNYDHFDLIEQLDNKDQPLTAMILTLINDFI
ncbi:unnamed protein product [Rotaria sp. Silwood2]|nr:unnamed protein product [Rotaria sp. Silwood2]